MIKLKMPRFRLYWLLWLAIPVPFWWFFRGINLQDIAEAFRGLGPIQILILALLDFGIFLVLTSRWWLIIHQQGYSPSFVKLSGYRLLSIGLDYFIPGPQFSGSTAQVYLLKEKNRVPTSSALASVTMDKFLDMISNYVFLIIGVVVALKVGIFSALAPVETILFLLAVTAMFAGYGLAIWMGKTPISWLLNRIPLPGRFEHIRSLKTSIASTEQEIFHFCQDKPRTLLEATGLSVLIWVGMILEYYLILYFLGLRLSIFQAVIAMMASRIALLVPMPAGVGILEFSQVLAMHAFGISASEGMGVSLMIRGRDMLMSGTGLLFGLLFFSKNPEARLPSQPNENNRF